MSGSNIVNTNLARWYQQKMAGVQGVGMIIAAEAAKKSKADHPWKNQTHHAEQGLYGEFKWKGTQGIIEHGHRVIYGPNLELARDGKYAVLEPTLNSLRQEFLNRVKQIMGSKF